MVALAISATTSTTVTLGVSGLSGGVTAVDVQYSTRPDFRFALSPLIPNVTPAGGQIVVQHLNQRTTYFFRVRERSGGAVGPWTDGLPAFTPNASSPILTPNGANKAPAFLVVPEHVAAWTAESSVAGHPPLNLGTDSPNDQWWADFANGGYAVEAQIGGAPVDTIALLETNAPANMTIRVKAGPSLANVRGGAPAYTSANQSFHASANLGGKQGYHALVRLPAAQSYPFWRIEMGGRAPLDRFVASYACLGLARSAGKNMADESTEVSIDLGELERSREGNPDRRLGFRRGRKVEFDIAMMTEAAWESQFADLRQAIGANDPILVVPNSRANAFLHDRLLFGTVDARMSHPRSTRFTASLTVNSVI